MFSLFELCAIHFTRHAFVIGILIIFMSAFSLFTCKFKTPFPCTVQLQIQIQEAMNDPEKVAKLNSNS
jgi:hypothetical protein